MSSFATVEPVRHENPAPARHGTGLRPGVRSGRLALLGAAAMTLAGCVGGDDELSALQLTAPADDAHCRSLLMQPGELVYAQCRLAMRRTYLNDYATRKAAIEAKYGTIGSEIDSALRNDTFCNYDESVKASMAPVEGEIAANTAYGDCGTTRDAFNTALADAFGGPPPGELLENQRQMVMTQNVASVAEARAVIGGPNSPSGS